MGLVPIITNNENSNIEASNNIINKASKKDRKMPPDNNLDKVYRVYN